MCFLDLQETRRHLRLNFYSGDNDYGGAWEEVNVAGCWETAKREMGAWLSKDRPVRIRLGTAWT